MGDCRRGGPRWIGTSGAGLFCGALVLLRAPSLGAQTPEPQPEPEVARSEASLSSEQAPKPPPEEESERLRKLEAAFEAQSQRLREQDEKLLEQDKKLSELEARAASAEQSALAATEASEAVLETDPNDAAVQQRQLALYGFADVAFTKLYVPERTRFSGLVDRNSRFAVGNFNLYMDANPSESFRLLGEVRFTLYPHGDYDSNFQRQDTRTYDQTSATGRNRVIASSVVIERAWIEWKKYDVFKVRSGLFLTPYGIWNVDHGSPTLISSVLPTFWASEYFPTRQLGVQVLGEFFQKEWEYGYRAYVSNGRMDQSQLEVDPFKLFGGRLYARYSGKVQALLGVSGYYNQEATIEKSVVSFDPFLVDGERTSQFKEFGLAGDVSFDVGDLRTRTEFVFHEREYVDGLRAQIPGSPVYSIDETRYNAYNTIAYRLPWAGLEPFTFIEYAKRPASSDNASWVLSGGIIEHLAPSTQLKFQAFYVHFVNDDVFPEASKSDFPGWDLRLVTAF